MGLGSAFVRLIRSLKHAWDPQYRSFKRMVKRYKRERSHGTVARFDGLSDGSVIFDFGGYKGDWTAKVNETCNGTFHIFEPHPTFAAEISTRFRDNPRIHIHAMALGSSSGTFTLSDNLDASSADSAGEGGIVCRMASVGEFLAAHPQPKIDVMKMNIEGGEYDLLTALLDGGYADRIGTILVQFHNFGPSDPVRRHAIRARLEETHQCDWCYDFVWEQWSRRDITPAAVSNQPG